MLRSLSPLVGGDVVAGGTIHANLSVPALLGHALRRGEGRLSATGALLVQTGRHTGRSVEDKFVVADPAIRDAVWWGKVNRPLDPAHFAALQARLRAWLAVQPELFVEDLYAGADPAHRLSLRLVTTHAWHALFARHMFLRPAAAERAAFMPEWVILHAPEFAADPEREGCRSGTAIVISFATRTVVIVGTSYAGEIKKSVFTVLNWLLPERGVLPLHCSANRGAAGDVALFFGLSGTGKTTLSSDPTRALIGDDEHGWSDEGVFNFEGGCYAKVIRLSREAEPEIWGAVHRFGTVLENVVADAEGNLVLDDASLTENTRACYPLDFIANRLIAGRAEPPRHVVMLTADAFGVLPPIARLTPAQAMYHFLSGYTARVAGTEKGLGAAPQATFSACFGAPFLPRPPQIYGRMLAERIARSSVTCWLINTGWSGGPYGEGRRMPIPLTRALLQAALEGRLNTVTFAPDPLFGLAVPQAVPGVPEVALDPRAAWPDGEAYDRTARRLLGLFEANFSPFLGLVDEEVRAVARRLRP